MFYSPKLDLIYQRYDERFKLRRDKVRKKELARLKRIRGMK